MYIYGAICPERNKGEAVVIGQVSKVAMAYHLKAISQCIPKDRHGVIVMDRAPWHRFLEVPDNMTIVYLPSYSPECNPHENVWEYLKNNYLSNRVYKDLDHLMEACCKAWNGLCSESGRINSIGMRRWATIK